MAAVGLLAGELGSAGGCNVNLPASHDHHGSHQLFAAALPGHMANHPALIAGLAAAAIVVWFVLIIVFTYISSVMRFILFDSVVARECHIRQGWARRKREGLRLFWWQISLMVVSLASLLVLVGAPIAWAYYRGWFAHARAHLMGLILGGIILLLLFLALVTLMALIQVMTKDFVVPQMALEDVGAVEGWRRLWLMLKSEKGGYAGYIGIKIALGLGAAIVFGIAQLIALLVVLIPIGGVSFAVVMGAKAAGWTWNVYTITLAVVLGIILLVLVIFLVTLVAVPVAVFFPAYSIYFFAPRYPPLGSLLWPEPSAPVTPG